MYNLQNTLESKIKEILASGDYNGNFDELGSKITSMIPGLSESTAESMLKTIKKDAATNLAANRREQRQFEKRLEKLWGKPLDLLELFIELATEAGRDFNSKFRNDAVRSNDAVFEALTRLHAKSCQTARAILTLLRSGYADDAYARWRSLHESSVVSFFISKHGQKMAERYLLHGTIQRYNLADQHQKYAARISEEPLPQEEFDRLKSKRDKFVDRFGKLFRQDYGWATSVIPSIKTMRDIEEDIGLDHMRPYYKMASDNEHPNSHGTYYRLGLILGPNNVLLAGPSNAGLANPGHSTAISLHQVTTTLLATRSDFDCIVVMNIHEKLTDEIGQAFLKVHQELEALDGNEDQAEETI